jgi:hypothetical protein
MAGVWHRIPAAPLRPRGLLTISGRGSTWKAALTAAGAEYLQRVDGPNPPRPRQANVAVTRQLVGCRRRGGRVVAGSTQALRAHTPTAPSSCRECQQTPTLPNGSSPTWTDGPYGARGWLAEENCRLFTWRLCCYTRARGALGVCPGSACQCLRPATGSGHVLHIGNDLSAWTVPERAVKSVPSVSVRRPAEGPKTRSATRFDRARPKRAETDVTPEIASTSWGSLVRAQYRPPQRARKKRAFW